MTTLTEADVEADEQTWLAGLGWQVAHGPVIAPGRSMSASPRTSAHPVPSQSSGMRWCRGWRRGK